MKGWIELAEKNMKRIWIAIGAVAVWNVVLTILVFVR